MTLYPAFEDRRYMACASLSRHTHGRNTRIKRRFAGNTFALFSRWQQRVEWLRVLYIHQADWKVLSIRSEIIVFVARKKLDRGQLGHGRSHFLEIHTVDSKKWSVYALGRRSFCSSRGQPVGVPARKDNKQVWKFQFRDKNESCQCDQKFLVLTAWLNLGRGRKGHARPHAISGDLHDGESQIKRLCARDTLTSFASKDSLLECLKTKIWSR